MATGEDENFQDRIQQRFGGKPAGETTNKTPGDEEELHPGTESKDGKAGSGLPGDDDVVIHQDEKKPPIPQQKVQPKSGKEKIPLKQEPIIFDPEKLSDDDFHKVLDKRTNGRFKTMNDLQDFMEKSIIPANERLRKANEWAAKEGDELKFYEIQGKDWAKVPDLDLAMEKVRSEYGDDTDKEVLEAILNQKYNLEADPDSLDFKVGQANLKRDSSSLREAKIAEQSTNLVPPSAQKATEAETARNNALKEWEIRTEKVISSFNGLEIEINGKPFKYVPKDPEQLKSYRQSVKQALGDTNGTMAHALANSDRYNGEDGVQKFVQDMFILNNFDSILSTFGNAKGNDKVNNFVENNLKGGRKNPQRSPGGGGAGVKSIAKQVAEAQRKRGY